MFEGWKNRRIRKKEIAQQVRDDKLERRKRQEEFARLPESERQIAEKKDKQRRKEEKLKKKRRDTVL